MQANRISRLRANHANNIEVILVEISDTVEEINRRAEALGQDFKIAAQNTGLDVLLLTFAGGQLRSAARTIYPSGTIVVALLNEMEDYQKDKHRDAIAFIARFGTFHRRDNYDPRIG